MNLSKKSKKFFTEHRWLSVLLVLLAFIVIGEVFLRTKWGFCHAPLYQESTQYEYIVCPNQAGVRFGKRYAYNSFSQRSEEPQPHRKKILGLGDSVLFGGATTDQDSIATSIFSTETGIQMLNIASGSWGPDNCAAYLREKGLFDAQAMFLLVSSHDAYDCMTFKPVVGKHSSYPDKQYHSAWGELIVRYLYPRTLGRIFPLDKAENDPDQQVVLSIDGTDIHKASTHFNSGFAQLKAMAAVANIPLVVCLHPDLKELEAGTYNKQGKAIIDWCAQNKVPLILELKEGIQKEMYRDGIHINERGQRFLSSVMKKYMYPLMALSN